MMAQIALAVERTDPATGDRQIIGVGRLQGIHAKEAEFSIVISDEYQKQGLGGELMKRLIDIARQEGVKVITADILADNAAMQKVAEKAGFKLTRDLGEPTVLAKLELS